MANATNIQTLLDGERNLVVKVVGILDTSNDAQTVVDVSALVPAALRVRIDKVTYSISSQLAVNLLWDANTDVPIVSLSGFGHIKAKHSGGLTNNGGTGVTGDVKLTTTGWTSGIQTYTLLIEMVKTTD